MMNWKQVAASPDTTIEEVVNLLDRTALQIVLIVDDQDCLLGTVTDGDIRRGLLKGVKLSDRVAEIYNRTPITASVDDSEEIIHFRMTKHYIRQMPVVTGKNRMVRLEVLKNILSRPKHSSPVILMAGGLGTRLRPLTEDCPKPLLKVGGKPVLETILEKFIRDGFEQFYISVNYKADMIESYFGDGRKWDVRISYIREKERLGTAGGLGLLEITPDAPVIVMNGDLLTKVNFNHLLDFHNEHQAKATMCVREYNVQIPYGVVNSDGVKLVGLHEKPKHHFFVNAGIYVLSPEVFQMIPKGEFFDMPDLFQKLLENSEKTVVFPIKEYWVDIGQIKDFETANLEYGQVFCA